MSNSPPGRDDAGVRAQLKRLLEVIRANEELARRFFELETVILGILEFRDLCKRLLEDIEAKFQTPHVWLVIVEESPAAEFLRDPETRRVLGGRLKLLPEARFARLTDGSVSPLLVNRRLLDYQELMTGWPDANGAGSLAVVPLFLGGRPAGSLNLYDCDPHRFRPELETLFLSRLSTMVSLCLANVEAHERLRRMSREDPLTGLVNRRVMEAILEAEFARSKETKSPLSVAFIDMDDFKGVNDTFGHDQGDEFLKRFAARLKEAVRPVDLPARFAGDEFICIMPGLYADEARRIMDNLEQVCEREGLPMGEGRIPMRFTYGVAQSGLGGDKGLKDARALLRRADSRLYQYKKKKRLERNRTPPPGGELALEEPVTGNG